MKYQDYKGWTKPYVLVHNTGDGVMEAPYVEHEVVFQTDTMYDAEIQAKRFEREFNPKKDWNSSWKQHTFHININTSCPEGKRLLDEFNKEANKAFQKVKDNPGLYRTLTNNGMKFYFQKLPEFDNPKDDEANNM